MKNRGTILLLCLTISCFFLLFGIFLGRNFSHSPITVSIIEPEATQSLSVSDDTDTSLVNINTAPVYELVTLPGIGDMLAQRIVEYRSANGPFTSVTGLLNVEGIGENKLEQILMLITVGG